MALRTSALAFDAVGSGDRPDDPKVGDRDGARTFHVTVSHQRFPSGFETREPRKGRSWAVRSRPEGTEAGGVALATRGTRWREVALSRSRRGRLELPRRSRVSVLCPCSPGH